MKNYIATTNEIFGLDDGQVAQGYLPEGSVLIPSTYTSQQYPYLTLQSGKIVFDAENYGVFYQSFQVGIYNNATQNLLNSTAQSWGYDNMVSAVSYVGSNNAQFSAEGTALSNWRDTIWAKVIEIEAGPLPATTQDFLLLLPPAPAKPTA